MTRKINRCMKCMQVLEDDWEFCPDCGYDNQHQSNSERALSIGTVLNGKYLIGAVLGEGGFGITYAAWDMLIEVRIAIKEYFPSELVTRDTTLSEENSGQALTLIKEQAGESRYREGLARFVKEAENLAKFQKQQGVVSVKDFFYENNTAYMVMEYIDGVTLSAYLGSHNGKLRKEEAFRMMEPVMKTLEAIHREGIVHRDISPDNIMVTADGQMKLIDFGAARFVGADDEKSLTVILKHGYAPEEQYRSNGEQGTWTDVYALSAVIYRMLTGKVPEETLKRMTEKQDSVHVELGKVQELSKVERKCLEKGLAVNAQKRLRTMGELYNGIYVRKRQNIWNGVAAGFAAAVIICLLIVGAAQIRNRDEEEILAVADEVQEEINDSGLAYMQKTDTVDVGVGESEMTEIEEPEIEEPENIRALREYYNVNDMWKTGKACFMDMTGDGKDEMIVAEERKSDSSIFDVVVYQYKNSDVEEIYHSDGRDWIYYLYIENGDAYILRKYIKTTYSGWDSVSEFYYEKVSLMNMDNESRNNTGYPDEEMEELIKKSVLLLYSRTGALFWIDGEMLADYQSVMEQKEMFEEALQIGKSAGKAVLDYTPIYDGDDKCLFVVTENRDEDTYSIWASHDGQLEELAVINPSEEFDWGYDGEWESKVYQFGKAQQYILELIGTEQWKQHKFCYEDGIVRNIDNDKYFDKDENGRIKMLIEGYPDSAREYSVPPGSSNGELYMMRLIDIFYYDHQYVEYGAETVDAGILEQYENYREILQEAEENLLKVKGIEGTQENASYEVERVVLDNIRKAENGTLYLNYRTYGKMDEGNYSVYGNVDEVLKEPDADGNYANNEWACVVLEEKGKRLEIENQYIGQKEEYSGSGFPIYYGPDRKLEQGGRARDELRALIEDKSGKSVVVKSYGCYEDFDGDGSYELFAFVADSAWAYLSNRPSMGDVCMMGEAIGCELWFSDGEQTVQVAELADGYGELSMEVLRFGESLQCSLTRLLPGRYLSTDEILTSGGYATTVCVLENGEPHVVVRDENLRFYQKEGSGEIGCYGPYGTWREDDSVFYENGNYYWKSDNISVLG